MTEDDYERQGLSDINDALERSIGEEWGNDAAWSSIGVEWIEHMALVHGAHCAGRHCAATADTPAYVGALRRMWADSAQYGHPQVRSHPATHGYRDAIRDLAHELGVDLDA